MTHVHLDLISLKQIKNFQTSKTDKTLVNRVKVKMFDKTVKVMDQVCQNLSAILSVDLTKYTSIIMYTTPSVRSCGCRNHQATPPYQT
jgi:hypothetical protein